MLSNQTNPTLNPFAATPLFMVYQCSIDHDSNDHDFFLSERLIHEIIWRLRMESISAKSREDWQGAKLEWCIVSLLSQVDELNLVKAR